MTRSLSFDVYGLPAPQGSKRHVGNGVMIESSKRVKPWRAAVEVAAREAIEGEWEPFTGPLALTLTFYLPRPKAHYGTGRNASVLKPDAPKWVSVRPDIDKLARSTLDALTTSGVWVDDSQVAHLTARKLYANTPRTGADITITEL